MRSVKRVWNLEKDDLAYVMDPSDALSALRGRTGSPHTSTCVFYQDNWYGKITESDIKDGSYVVLALSPQYYLVERSTGDLQHFLPFSLEFYVKKLLGIQRGGGSGGNQQAIQPEEKPDWWHEVKGAAKQVVNDVVRSQAASTAEWLHKEGVIKFEDKKGNTLTAEDVGKAYRNTGKTALNILDKEQQGAAAIAAVPAYPAVLLALDTLLGRGRDIVRDPKGFSRDLQNALKDARSEAEALGNLGMEQAKRRLGHSNDPRYNNRYHGPDGMTQDSHGKLSEWEAKGNRHTNRTVAEDVAGNKQGSQWKNIRRAKIMTKKQAKVNQPSDRQGGPYTQAEIDLWIGIKASRGHKRHISSHTNTTTGETVVFERDTKGNISTELDRFKIDNFNEAREVIQEVFK
ncbi:MAG: hypothetical protein OIF55_18650 [Amphritea sp.]|nr:hypothetical protein [Amphritea sp.]